jgi:Fe-S oxidoreductase
MYYEPFIGQAAVLVLEHNGYEVIVPEQNCCGLPMLSNGEFPPRSAITTATWASWPALPAPAIPSWARAQAAR